MAFFILILAIFAGIITASIAERKGYSWTAWWFYGLFLFIVALPHALLLKPNLQAIEKKQLASGDLRKCPFCAEIIKSEAKVCRFCGRDLPEMQRTPL